MFRSEYHARKSAIERNSDGCGQLAGKFSLRSFFRLGPTRPLGCSNLSPGLRRKLALLGGCRETLQPARTEPCDSIPTQKGFGMLKSLNFCVNRGENCARFHRHSLPQVTIRHRLRLCLRRFDTIPWPPSPLDTSGRARAFNPVSGHHRRYTHLCVPIVGLTVRPTA